MADLTRLSVAGLPAAFVTAIFAAVGSAAGVGAVDGISSAPISGVGASTGVSTVAAAGISRAAAVASAAGRVAGADAFGGSTRNSIGSSLGQGTAVAYPVQEHTRLSVAGVPGAFYSVENKAVIVARAWQVEDTLTVSVTIGDITDRAFNLADVLYLSGTDELYFPESAGVSIGLGSAAAIATSINAAVGASAGVALPTAAAEALQNTTGAGDSYGLATVSGQGATAGTIYGIGAAASQGSCNVDAASIQYNGGAASASGAAIAAAIGDGLVESVADSSGTCTAEFTPSDDTVGSSAGSATVAGVLEAVAGGVFASGGAATVSGRSLLVEAVDHRRIRVTGRRVIRVSSHSRAA